MRIGLLTYGMGRYITGIGRYTLDLAHELATHEEVWLLNPDGHLKGSGDLRHMHIPGMKTLPQVLTIGPSILRKVARRLDLDVLHDPCGIAPFTPNAPWLQVVTLHDAIPVIHPRLQPFLTRYTLTTFPRRADPSTDAIVTVSHHARRDLIRTLGISPDKVHVIYPGTHHPGEYELQAWNQAFHVDLRTRGIRKPYFLSVGDGSPRKNLRFLVEAFRNVRTNHPEASLVLVGPASRMTALSQDGVEVLHYVPDSLLHVLYTNAAAVLHPSLYEGFGFPALEAMAHGVPIIASNTSSLPEVVGSAGLLLDPTEKRLWVGAMTDILTNRYSAGNTSSRIQASRFEWTRSADQLTNLYEELLMQKGVVI